MPGLPWPPIVTDVAAGTTGPLSAYCGAEPASPTPWTFVDGWTLTTGDNVFVASSGLYNNSWAFTVKYIGLPDTVPGGSVSCYAGTGHETCYIIYECTAPPDSEGSYTVSGNNTEFLAFNVVAPGEVPILYSPPGVC